MLLVIVALVQCICNMLLCDSTLGLRKALCKTYLHMYDKHIQRISVGLEANEAESLSREAPLQTNGHPWLSNLGVKGRTVVSGWERREICALSDKEWVCSTRQAEEGFGGRGE